MNKRGEETRIVLWGFYLVLVMIVIGAGKTLIDNAAESSTFNDRYIATDTSLLLDTVSLAPGKLNLNYKYGERKLDIENGRVKSNNILSKHQSNINQNILIRKSLNNNLKIRNNDFVFPVNQKIVTSCFGNRNSAENTNHHDGIDLRANYEAVSVIADGKVIDYVNGKGKQNSLTIEHENGIKSRYLHLDSISKEIVIDSNFKCIKNCEVKKGMIIAKSGQHGPNSHTQYSPHLHFELIINGIARDPINYIFGPRDFSFKQKTNCYDNYYVYSYEIKERALS